MDRIQELWEITKAAPPSKSREPWVESKASRPSSRMSTTRKSFAITPKQSNNGCCDEGIYDFHNGHLKMQVDDNA